MVAQTGQGIRVIADPVSATWSRHGRQRSNARPVASASSPLGFPTISATRTASGEPMSYPIDAEKGRCFKCGRVHPGTYSCERTTHTPGPWAMRQERFEYVVRDANGRRLFGGSWHDSHDKNYPLQPASEKNLRLASAAPDLLALAKRYASECAWCSGTGTIEHVPFDNGVSSTSKCIQCADIRAVIDKAEGGA